ncbi:MAG: sulfotransferase family protein [Actinobacteria bacterium]|nr:MAG: sulfotransferase family protein [Actinomycetota bacterium]
MELKIVGAGLGRTGTNSLKVALEQLLGDPCYHMYEVAAHPADAARWHAAVRGERVDWDALLAGYAATVDWPASAFWRELLEANPRALVLLSTREHAEQWWESAARTIIPTVSQPLPVDDPDTAARRGMIRDMMRMRFTPDWRERDGAIAAYERHNAQVRATVPAARLIDWRPGDGWEPICSALGVPVPDEPFPHVNTTAQFHSRQEKDAEQGAS